MTDDTYKGSLEAARAEMEALLDEEARIEARLIFVRTRNDVLRRTIVSLGDLLGEDREPQSVGITDAIRQVLATYPKAAFFPTSIRRALEKQEFPVNDYKNPLAVIHTTLKRLEDQGEIKAIAAKNGKTMYHWIKKDDDDIPF